MPSQSSGHPLIKVAQLFLELGAISFGGPAAHIALMEEEVVTRRGWLDREHFLDLLAATNLVPGPNAVEMAAHIGFVHAGWPGLVVGAASFIIPAVAITLAIAWVYVNLGVLPQVAALFYGINPAVLAIVLAATYRLGRAALKDTQAILLACASLAAVLLGAEEALVLIAAGLAGILLGRPWRKTAALSPMPIGLWLQVAGRTHLKWEERDRVESGQP